MSILKNVVIGGTVYNCEKYIDNIMKNIQSLKELFKTIRIIISIDEGNDKSFEKLLEWKRKSDYFELHILYGYKSSNIRTENLANARNKILTKARELYLIEKYSYFIMMDCDDVCNTPIDISVLKNVLSKSDMWDAVSFPNLGFYYDTWALSYDRFILSYLHSEIPEITLAQIKKDIGYKLSVDEWVPVYSAFGGFAIHKSWFIFLDYDWKFSKNLELIPKHLLLDQKLPEKYNEEDCEHRNFYFKAVFKHGARIYIYSKNIFSYRDSYKFPPQILFI
jgi:hypothetical protein